MSLQRSNIQLILYNWSLHQRDSGVLRCSCQFLTTWAVCNTHYTIPMKLSTLKDWAVVWNGHWKRLWKEVTTDFKWGCILLLCRFLLLCCRVFQRSWCSTIARGFDLLVESYRHICLLKFCWQLTEPGHILCARVIVIDWFNIDLLITSDKDAPGPSYALCKNRYSIWSSVADFLLLRSLCLKFKILLITRTGLLNTLLLHLLDEVFVDCGRPKRFSLDVGLIRRLLSSIDL